jgi:hypothetical protein
MYCGHCGKKHADDATVCPWCGSRVTGVMPIRPEPAGVPYAEPASRQDRPSPRIALGPSHRTRPEPYRPPSRPPARYVRQGSSKWRGFVVVGIIVALFNAMRSCATCNRYEPPHYSTPQEWPEPKEIQKQRQKIEELLQRYDVDPESGRLTPRSGTPAEPDHGQPASRPTSAPSP